MAAKRKPRAKTKTRKKSKPAKGHVVRDEGYRRGLVRI